MQNPPAPSTNTKQPPPQLTTAFPSNANGSASTSAVLSSPTTPFSQSMLPSRSLLSRQDTLAFDPSLPGGGNAGVVGAHPSPLALPKNVQKSLQAIIRQIFESCFEVGAYLQVVGIAIEARNLEVLREAIVRANKDERQHGLTDEDGGTGKGEELLEYVLDVCMNIVQERSLRQEVGSHTAFLKTGFSNLRTRSSV